MRPPRRPLRRLLLAALAALALRAPRAARAWNIGGHSPVADVTNKYVTAAARYALTSANDDARKLDLPDNAGRPWTLGEGGGPRGSGAGGCGCRGCGCIVSATKQIVAGVNWVLTLRIVPTDPARPDEYRLVTVFDESFKGKDDKFTVSKSETIDADKAGAKAYTQAAVDSMTDPNAESHATAASDAAASSTGNGGGNNAAARNYLDKLTKRTRGLVTKVQSKPDGCDDAPKAKAGDSVSVHYTGTLTNGQKFDSSYDRGTPFVFKLGDGQVIKGWEQGIPGMCVGEKIQLFIPPDLAYGDRGFGNLIPPKSSLQFEVELMGIN